MTRSRIHVRCPPPTEIIRGSQANHTKRIITNALIELVSLDDEGNELNRTDISNLVRRIEFEPFEVGEVLKASFDVYVWSADLEAVLGQDG